MKKVALIACSAIVLILSGHTLALAAQSSRIKVTVNNPVLVTTAEVNGDTTLINEPFVPVRPTFMGTSQPGADITITVHSNPIICHTVADSNGNWKCVLPELLPPGKHTVIVDIIYPGGATERLGPYTIHVKDKGPFTPIFDGSLLAPDTGGLRVGNALIRWWLLILIAIGGIAFIVTITSRKTVPSKPKRAVPSRRRK